MMFAVVLQELSVKGDDWGEKKLNITKWSPDVFYCVGISVLFS